MTVIVLCMIFAAAAVWFGVRCYVLKRAVRAADEELRAVIEDISANRRMKLAAPDKDLEALLQTINQSLEEIWRERMMYEKKERDLLSQIENISHDLRTPLTSILGYLDLMDADGMGEEEKESVEVIQRKAKALQQLIGEFYDLTRIEAADFSLEPKEMDAGRIVRECVLGFYENLTRAGIEVVMEIPEKPVWVMADESAFDRIISNLMQNVVRYAKSTLKINVDKQDGQVFIRFANDAEHLSEEDALHLFDRFYQKDGSRSREGTGLGLTIAKYLTEAMGGQLDAVYENEWLEITIKL